MEKSAPGADSPVELCLSATEGGHTEEYSQAEDQRVLDIAHDDFLILINRLYVSLALVVDQLEELGPGALSLKSAAEVARRRDRILLLHPAHLHTEVPRLDHQPSLSLIHI